MSWRDDVLRFEAKLGERARAFLVGSVALVHTSITDGHEITGAPGQPVDTGHLRASWQATFPEDLVGEVITNTVYAPPIEDGVGRFGPMTLRSEVGGFHSVKLTRAAWPRIIEHVMARVRAAHP